MKTSTRIIDYHLKGCMKGGFLKITLSGRRGGERGVQITLLFGLG